MPTDESLPRRARPAAPPADSTDPGAPAVEDRLTRHLESWLGRWPPRAPVEVISGGARTQPGWDGGPSPFAAVRSPEGMLVSVTPLVLARLGGPLVAGSIEEIRGRLMTALGAPRGRFYEGVFRWSESPAALEPVGEWVDATDPAVPAWLRPFGGRALVAFDDEGRYAAGVGLKCHDDFGREIAVGTEERHRGRGLARRLVAQAARRIIDDGRIPTYLHGPDNAPSAAVADAAGFPDRQWRVMGLSAADQAGG